MKLLLATLLYLLTLTSAHAQGTWPRNPKTGKVEFRGSLPWPASVKTEAQRRALVRRWYLTKLTDETPEEVEQDARKIVSPALLTYANLPNAVVIDSDHSPAHSTLAYIVALTPTAQGLTVKAAEFHFSHATDNDLGPELEQVLAADSAADRPALAALRKRLAAAVASW